MAGPKIHTSADRPQGLELRRLRKNVIKLGEYYMVRDKVWKRAGMNGWEGNLCFMLVPMR
jgi:hypothetical protein